MQILEGLANLDEGYAQRRATEKRDAKQNEYMSARDERLNNLQLKRDQLLAAEQAVRDARLHGNEMEVRRAEIEATKARDEFRAAHEAKEANKDREFKTGERKGSQEFQADEGKKERKFKNRLQSVEQRFRTGERLGEQKWRSSESELDRTEREKLLNKEHQNRLDQYKAMTDEDLRKAKGLAAEAERRRRDEMVHSFPDDVPIEDRYKKIREADKRRLIDQPEAESTGRMQAIKDSGGMVLFPGAGSYLRGRGEGGGTGLSSIDDGRIGLTIDDLRKGAPLLPPQQPEKNQTLPALRSLIQ